MSFAKPRQKTPLKMRDLDLDAFQRANPPLSLPLSILHRFVTVHLLLAVRSVMFFVDLLVVLWLLPLSHDASSEDVRLLSVGEFDTLALPSGFPRHLFTALLALSLGTRLFFNFYKDGMRVAWRGRLGELMVHSDARELDGALNLTRWRFYRFVQAGLPERDARVGWLLRASEEWRRFFIIKTPLFVLMSGALYAMLIEGYSLLPATGSQSDDDRTTAFLATFYLSLKFLLYIVELLVKVAALLIWLCAMGARSSITSTSALRSGRNGAVYRTLRDDYMDAVEEHARLVMKNFEWASRGRNDAASAVACHPDAITPLDFMRSPQSTSRAFTPKMSNVSPVGGLPTPIAGAPSGGNSQQPAMSKLDALVYDGARASTYTAPLQRWSMTSDDDAEEGDVTNGGSDQVGPETPLIDEYDADEGRR